MTKEEIERLKEENLNLKKKLREVEPKRAKGYGDPIVELN